MHSGMFTLIRMTKKLYGSISELQTIQLNKEFMVRYTSVASYYAMAVS